MGDAYKIMDVSYLYESNSGIITMSVTALKHVLLELIKEDEHAIQKALCRRLLNDINVNFNRWSNATEFSEISLDSIKQIHRCIAEVLDESLIDATEFSVETSSRVWSMSPKKGAVIKNPHVFQLIITILIKLLDRISYQNLKKATTLIDLEILDFSRAEPNRHGLSKLHEVYSTVINDLMYELIDVKGYSVKVLLTRNGMLRMRTTSDFISLTPSSQRGYKVDMVTGEIHLNVSINGHGGWHLLTKDDYKDILVLVQDPRLGHDLGYVSILDAVLKPLIPIQSHPEVSYDSDNVIAFKRK